MADGFGAMGCCKIFVDESDEEGLYILTGSTIVDESKIPYSGAGRIKKDSDASNESV